MMDLKSLSKDDLIWIIRQFEKRSLGHPSLGSVLNDLNHRKEIDKINEAERVAELASKKRDEYITLLKPYVGKPIADIPESILHKCAKLAKEAEALDDKWFRLSGIKRTRRASNE